MLCVVCRKEQPKVVRVGAASLQGEAKVGTSFHFVMKKMTEMGHRFLFKTMHIVERMDRDELLSPFPIISECGTAQ